MPFNRFALSQVCFNGVCFEAYYAFGTSMHQTAVFACQTACEWPAIQTFSTKESLDNFFRSSNFIIYQNPRNSPSKFLSIQTLTPVYFLQRRWQDAINKVSLNLRGRRTSGSTRGGSFHSDSEEAGDKLPPVKYENTFRLDPTSRFPTKRAEDIIKVSFAKDWYHGITKNRGRIGIK